MKSGVRRALAPRSQGGPPVSMGASQVMTPGMSGGANPDLALIRAYKQNGTNYANVSLLASATAAQDWKLYRKTGPGRRYTTSDKGSDQRKEVTVHPALNCLNNPASIPVTIGAEAARWPVWDRMGLFEISQIWMDQTGKSHWVVDTAEGASKIPLGLWPVRPDRIVPVPDRDRYLAGWLYRSPDGRETVPLLPNEVIFNRYPDPEDPYGGCGPISSVLTDIQAADYAADWNRNYFINSAEPGGIIQLDTNLDEPEFDQFVARWRESHRGVARAHRIGILEAGAQWVPNSHSMRDMDFANLRSVMRDTIREAVGMHKVMTGVTDDVNRANAQTGEEVFSSWKVDPRLKRWRNVLNTQFLPLFGALGQDVEFDYVYPSPQNREQDNQELTTKTAAVAVLVGAGFDPADACEVVGLPPMKTAERATQEPALPPGWVPAEGAPAADPMENVRRQMAAWNLAGVAA